MCFFPWYWSRKSFFLVLPWKWENEKFLSASSLRNALLRYTTTEPQRLYSELSHYKIHIFCITDILHTVKISIAKSVLCIDRIKKMVNFQAWWWNKERWFFFCLFTWLYRPGLWKTSAYLIRPNIKWTSGIKSSIRQISDY